MNSVITQTPNDYIYVEVQNGGGYFAKFSVDYYFNRQYHVYNSGNLSLGFSERVDIPGIVQNLYLKVEVWLQPFDHIVYDGPVRNYLSSCFYLYGTIFNPVCVQVPCNVPSTSNLCCRQCCSSC